MINIMKVQGPINLWQDANGNYWLNDIRISRKEFNEALKIRFICLVL